MYHIGEWFLFTGRGISGWKSLIPFHAYVTFGKMSDDEDQGWKLFRISIYLFITLVIILVLSFLTWRYMVTDLDINILISGTTEEVNQMISESFNYPTDNQLIGIGLFMIMGIVLFLMYISNLFKLRKNFVIASGYSLWSVLIWALPSIAMIYFAVKDRKKGESV